MGVAVSKLVGAVGVGVAAKFFAKHPPLYKILDMPLSRSHLCNHRLIIFKYCCELMTQTTTRLVSILSHDA